MGKRDDKIGFNKMSLLLENFVNCCQMSRKAVEFKMLHQHT